MNINWNKPSAALFRHVRGLTFNHNDSGLDFYLADWGDTLKIAFAETGNRKEWIFTDFAFFPKLYDGVSGHGGIFKQYKSIRATILDLVYSGRFKNIYVAGFSLGAALTTCCVQDIAYHIDRDGLDCKVNGVAFDGPRFFALSLEFNNKIKKVLKDRLIQVITRNDPVPHLPPWLFGFRHCGEKIRIGKWYRLLPIQHLPAQVDRALVEKFGE